MDKQKTGELIKNARNKMGYTQKELGDLIGVSNKAISRWEIGETFPDVALLETLAVALNLKIEDIVLGEVSEKEEHVALGEIVRTVKIQQTKKMNGFVIGGISLLLMVYLIYRGFCTLRGRIDWPVTLYYYSLAAILLFVNVKALYESNVCEVSRFTKWVPLMSLVSGIYAFFVTCVASELARRGQALFNIKLEKLGPIVNWQLSVVFIVNIAFILIMLYKVLKDEEKISLGMYASIAVAHLVLIFSDLLHRLSEPQAFVKIFILDAVGVFGLMIFMYLGTKILKKRLGKTCMKE